MISGNSSAEAAPYRGQAPTERFLSLRARSARGRFTYRTPEMGLHFYRSMAGSADEPWFIIRRARRTADILRGLTPVVFPRELIAGRLCHRELSADEREELADAQQRCSAIPVDGGQRAHQAVDLEKLLHRGIKGVRREIEDQRACLDIAVPEDMEKDAFYRACLIALDGFGALAEHYQQHVEWLAAREENPVAAGEYDDLARVLARVPHHPAETFREALQAVHLLNFALCTGQFTTMFQAGRPDRYLWPYYRQDVEAGRLSWEEAQELIDAFCLHFNDYTYGGLAVGLMVGGRDGQGNGVTNDLSWMFLDSIAHVRMAYPGVGLCWHPDMPDALLRRGCELLAGGLSHPAFFNDETISAGLRRAGLSEPESRLYINSTCVEITPIASSNVHVASPYINLPQCLNDVLGVPPLEAGDGSHGGRGFETYEALWEQFQAHLTDIVRQGVVAKNTEMMTRRYHGGAPLQSCFVNDCLSRGKDIDHGGARYNWIEPSFVGLGNVVDALAAIRRHLFEERRVSWEQLEEALRTDFEGQEPLRQLLLNRSPKYGNDEDEVDGVATRVTDLIVEACRPFRTYLGDSYQPGLFCWQMHQQLGSVTAATADGRRAGWPFADGAGPVQGRERRGPSAAVLSATKWDHSPMLGGIAMNVKFSRSGFRGDLPEAIFAVVKTYLELSGFEIQVNVVDREALRRAQVCPEEHQDLVVRIGGYSDYFVNLSPGMQEEIIQRSEYDAV